MKKIKILLFGILIFAAIWFSFGAKNKQTESGTSKFDKSQYSLTDPASKWVIVNKQHPLVNTDYVPAELHDVGYKQKMSKVAAKDLVEMMVAAKISNIAITYESGYRSYQDQVKAYNSIASGFSAAYADRESARPGYSEHQTGLAMDFGTETCKVQDCFANTKEGKWLAANSYKYGFILRYPPSKTDITGYRGESWHYRYVGKELALEMHRTNTDTLEEFFNVKGGNNY